MRFDEEGHECPATLGEYRDLCAAFGGEECDAVRWLDAKIGDQGRDARVLASDLEMRHLLMPQMMTRAGRPMSAEEWRQSQAARRKDRR